MRIGLGDKVKDTITGFEGVVIARTEWLNGCMRILVQPKALHDGKPIDAQSFDEPQLALVDIGPPAAKKPATVAEEEPRGGPRPEPQRPATPR